MSSHDLVRPSLVLLVAATLASAQTSEEAYRQAMAQCEESKQKGDFPSMAAAIRKALRYGPGDEYAWRNLAWALDRSGQWEDSLAVAKENIARNGVCGWSLEQLAESRMGAGEFDAAKATLTQIDALPPDAIGSAKGAIEGTRRRLLDLTGQRRYRLHWKVDLGQGGQRQKPARLLMPRE